MLRNADVRIFPRLIAVKEICFSIHGFYYFAFTPPPHTFPYGPSLTGLVGILAYCPPTPHPIVCWEDRYVTNQKNVGVGSSQQSPITAFKRQQSCPHQR